MKKMLTIAFLMMFISGGALFSQERVMSDYTFVNVFIERIYSHRLGYIVIYRIGPRPQQLASVFIPVEWFTEPSPRAERLMIANNSRDWPSMSVFTRNGEFSHVRLRVRRNRAHETWGMVPQIANIDEHFQGIEEIRLRF